MENKENNKTEHIAYCQFCGGRVGEISERTNELITSIYDCEKCNSNYCNQCSCETIELDKATRKCIKCNNVIEKVS